MKRVLTALALIGGLAFALAPCPAPAWPPRGESSSVVGDAVNVIGTPNNKSFTAYASDWCKYFPNFNLVRGVNYADTVDYKPSSFPDNTTFNMWWPAVKPFQWTGTGGNLLTCGVYGYMAAAFGNYDGNFSTPAVTPITLGALNNFTSEFDSSVGGNVAGFGGLHELYLTLTAPANGAGLTDKQLEVGFFPHTNAAVTASIKGATYVGLYNDRFGRIWYAGISGTFLQFVLNSEADCLKCTIDWKEALLWVRDQGRASNSWYVNGLALGAEPSDVGGSAASPGAWFKINRWRVVYN